MATRYVDPDADVGGDGTTSGLTGATCAYKSLNIWEAARQAVLAEVETVVCGSAHSNHTADATNVAVSGWTTTATNYIIITTDANNRASTAYNTSKYRLAKQATADQGGSMLSISQSYTRVTSLQIANSDAYGGPGDISLAAANCQISKCFLTSTGGAKKANPLYIPSYLGTTYVWNSVLVNGLTPWTRIGNTTFFYSCTFASLGAVQNDGTATFTNCLFSACTSDVTGSGTSTVTYCATSNDNTKGVPTATGNRHSQTFTFVGAGNYALAATDAGALGYGTDTSGASAPLNFTDDIDGTTRS